MKKAKNPCNVISLQHERKNPPAGFCQSHSHWRFVSGQNIVSAWGDIQTWQTVCLFNYLMAQLFIIKSRMRIPSNSTLHYFLSIKRNDDKLFKVCRLTQIPDRRILSNISSLTVPSLHVLDDIQIESGSPAMFGNPALQIIQRWPILRDQQIVFSLFPYYFFLNCVKLRRTLWEPVQYDIMILIKIFLYQS